jgi:hypothetical protein
LNYRVAYDASRNRLLLEISGFWTLDTVRDFSAATEAQVRAIPNGRADYDILIDSSGFTVQSAEVADMLNKIALGGLDRTRGRGATITGSQLKKMQASRTQTHPRMRIFLTAEEATSWLDTPADA